MKFTYLAKNSEGVITKGLIDAPDQDSASDALGKKSLTPISIKKEEATGTIKRFSEFGTIPSSQKVMFSKQLATLIGAGIPISQSMHILEEQTDNKKLKAAISEIASDIEGGLSLSTAMERQKHIFSPLYASMIKAGEVGGILDQTLEKVADEIEKEHELVAKIRGAMAYPSVILLAMLGVVIYMITNIIPQIGKVFSEMGGQLPATTRFLMGTSKIVSSYGIFIFAGLIAFFIFARRVIKKNPEVRYHWHQFLLKIPVIGKLIKKLNIARFTRTLGSLMTSGVTVLEAMEVSSDAIQNEVFKREIKEAAEKVKNGSELAEPLKTSKVFPIIVPSMIAVGEETGTMDTILKKLSDFYEKEVDNTVKNLSSLLEPMMMIIIGLGVGFIVISIITPIYQMSTLF